MELTEEFGSTVFNDKVMKQAAEEVYSPTEDISKARASAGVATWWPTR
jgi:hypothetical protein